MVEIRIPTWKHFQTTVTTRLPATPIHMTEFQFTCSACVYCKVHVNKCLTTNKRTRLCCITSIGHCLTAAWAKNMTCILLTDEHICSTSWTRTGWRIININGTLTTTCVTSYSAVRREKKSQKVNTFYKREHILSNNRLIRVTWWWCTGRTSSRNNNTVWIFSCSLI